MKIISISGVDGSGKSTQTKLLIDHLRNHGKIVFYFHAIEFSLANKIAYFWENGKQEKEIKSNVKANTFQIWLRKIFLRIDIWRFRRLARKLKKQNYDYILSDRYFLDSIVNIEYLSKKEFVFSLPEDIFPQKAFYLSVLPENIMKRSRVPDQGLAYLIDKQNIFEKKSIKWQMIFINGNKSVDEVFEEFISKI